MADSVARTVAERIPGSTRPHAGCFGPPALLSRRHCGRSSMVERKLPKLHTRVRFPSPAPSCFARSALRRIVALLDCEAGCPPKPWRRRAGETRAGFGSASQRFARLRLASRLQLPRVLVRKPRERSSHAPKLLQWINCHCTTRILRAVIMARHHRHQGIFRYR